MRPKARARRIKMILTDVDGTLTDGKLAVLPDGQEVKSYHVQDGLAVLKEAGLSAAVADAHPSVRREVHYLCKKKGGEGAFREFADFILGAQNKGGLITEKFADIFDRKGPS